MGKINLPISQEVSHNVIADKPNAPVVDDSNGFTFADIAEIDLKDEPVGDEINLTNEAVRIISLKQRLGISGNDKDDVIMKILKLAKDSGIKNKNQLYAKLKEISYKLGVSEPGTSVDRIYHYMKLDSQIKGLVNKQEVLYGTKGN